MKQLFNLVSEVFYPRSLQLNRDDLRESLNYQNRLSRNGVENHPELAVGVKIVRKTEWSGKVMDVTEYA